LKAYEAAAQNISKYDVLLVEDMSAEAYSKLLLGFGLREFKSGWSGRDYLGRAKARLISA
jgi:hypothetical protein